MEKIIFDEGYIEFAINGDENRVLKVNPSDIGLLERMDKSLKNLKTELENIKNQTITVNGEALENDEEAILLVKEINGKLRKSFDEIFYSGAADIVFGYMNPLALAGGKTVYENFMDSFSKAIKPYIDKASQESKKRIDKYKKEYDREASRKH